MSPQAKNRAAGIAMTQEADGFGVDPAAVENVIARQAKAAANDKS